MARNSKKTTHRGRKNKKNNLSSLIPYDVQSFIARRIIDSTALILTIAGMFLLISIYSYSPGDPSWNVAGSVGDNDLQVRNYAGIAGSYISDLFLQTSGYASVMLGVVLLFWGFRIFKRMNVCAFHLRFLSLVISFFALSTALSFIPSDLQTSAGGIIGNKISVYMVDIISFSSFEYANQVLFLFFASMAVISFMYASGVSFSGWFSFIKSTVIFVFNIFKFIFLSVMSFVEWVLHYGNEDKKIASKTNNNCYENRLVSMISSMSEILKKSLTQQEKQAEQHQTTEGISLNSALKHVNLEKEITGETDSGINNYKSAVIHAPSYRISGSGDSASKTNMQENGEWELPPIDLLQDAPNDNPEYIHDENVLRSNAEMLAKVLNDFNVRGDIVGIHPGPVVTLYELEPAPGVKTSRVISLSDDIARSMSAVSVRCAVIPGRNVIGIELPNQNRLTVYLRELLNAKEVTKSACKLPLILGKDIGGRPIIADLSKMPHLLIAGTTGSGKSVAVNTMILSLLYRLSPEKCRLIMIDPKMLELSVYDDIPHLLSPVVTEPGKAVVALKWAVHEMEERYRAMSKLGVRNIEGYNSRLKEAKKKGENLTRKIQTGFDHETGKPVYEEQPIDMQELPYIVIIVDEFADLMLVAGKEVEAAIQRLAQMARAAGLHLIMATQRPSVDVITGVIKANFPTRISFAVTSKIDSRTILGESGAEQLLGMGDMLYMSSGGRIKRVHGPFVSDHDVENVTTHLKAQGDPAYIDEITEGVPEGEGSEVMSALFGSESSSNVDEYYDQAVALVAREKKASTSFIQRYFQIGYNRAARIIEEMEKQGVVSKASPTGKREIYVSDYSETG